MTDDQLDPFPFVAMTPPPQTTDYDGRIRDAQDADARQRASIPDDAPPGAAAFYLTIASLTALSVAGRASVGVHDQATAALRVARDAILVAVEHLSTVDPDD